MEEQIKQLSSTLIEIYRKNMVFLQENFQELYERVEKLSFDIDKKKYKEKYSLEYIDGYFDILNLENNGYFYFTNTYEDADKRAKKVDFSLNSSLDLLRKTPDGKTLITGEAFKDVIPIISYMNEKVDFDNIQLEKIFKMTFIGSGLGIHIQEIYKKLDPLVTFIIEPELEIFRLSLFVTDYTLFSQGNKELFLSVEDDKNKRRAVYDQYYTFQEYMNFNIKYYRLLENYSFLQDEITEYFGDNSSIYFPYKLIIDNLDKTVGFMRDKEKFLNGSKMEKEKILKDKKVLIISAGPSLDSYIDWIEKHQDSFIIVCVDVIVKKLEKHNIIPNMVVSIDPSHLCADYLSTEDKDYLNRSAIILLSQQDKKVLEVLKNKNYYFSQVMPLDDSLGYLGSVPNVGTFSFLVTLYLGANEIYLIGNDAAFDQETGSRYAKDSAFTLYDNLEKNTSEDKKAISENDVIQIKGNLRETVTTNRGLATFKTDYERLIYQTDNLEYKAYNLSDGAYIEGLIPMEKEELEQQLENREILKFDIIKMANAVSNIVENLEYDDDIKILNTVLNRVKKYQKKHFDSKDDFLKNKLDLMIWIIEKVKHIGNSVFANIFLKYTALVDIYVNYILNIKQKNLHTKEEINKISQMWLLGVYNMFKDIKEAIK